MPIATEAPSRATVLAVWLRPLVDYLERIGFDSAEVFGYTGVDVSQVFVPGARLPLSAAGPLWQYAAQLTGKPFIGLEIANDAPPLQADVTAIAMMASRNLYEALQRFSRLSQFVCDAVQVVLYREGNELQLDFMVKPQERHVMPREAMDPALLIPPWPAGAGYDRCRGHQGASFRLRASRKGCYQAPATAVSHWHPLRLRSLRYAR